MRQSIEKEVTRLGVTHAYTVVLSMMVWGAARTWSDWRDSWALVNATEEQKKLALDVARSIPDPKEQENG